MENIEELESGVFFTRVQLIRLEEILIQSVLDTADEEDAVLLEKVRKRVRKTAW